MKSLYMLIVLLGIAILAPTPLRAAEIQVAATVPALGALAREVGGERVRVMSLSLPTQDPHFVDARPNMALALNRADLLIQVGLDLEAGWLPTLQKGARNSRILRGARGFLDCSAVVPLKGAEADTDRAGGDIHPGGNPHYLTAPDNAERCARAIAERLAELDPEHAAGYQSRFQSFARQLKERQSAWERAMKPYAGAPVVVYHRSWIYFTDWLNFEEVGAVEPKPGIPPTPGHVAGLLTTMQQKGVKLILQESFYPEATSRLLAERTGATIVKKQGGPSENQTYLEYVDDIIERIGKALAQ
jgi:zinc/manganese transport system substrate-binding protein